MNAIFIWDGMLAFALIGFALAAGSCLLALPLLRRFGILKRAYEDAPATHQAKTGTPTMGGISFVIALLPLLWFAGDHPLVDNPYLRDPAALLFWLVAACAAVGALDDLLAVRSVKGRGLRARTKFLLTALAAVIFLRALSPGVAPVGVILTLPNFTLAVPYWLWLLLGIVAIAGTIHAVNLTDGLDGLATGTMVSPLLALAIISTTTRLSEPLLAATLGLGACLGFLLFNRHPAKLFMGDTGSLALGALLSGTAILSGEMLLLIVIGFVFVAEALSVMLQVTYYKLSHGKRIFRMSPLHHHFELLGWPESKVTARFWLASAICSAIGLAIAR